MKLFILILVFALLAIPANADKLQVPFSCYPKKVQAKFAEHDIKLDLDGNDRTEESWGFLKSEGAQFWIYTYRAVTSEELTLIKNIVMER